MQRECKYNTINNTSPSITDCIDCAKTYELQDDYCCLEECGEHEFCIGCKKGIYKIN